jgi:hypothetical protein
MMIIEKVHRPACVRRRMFWTEWVELLHSTAAGSGIGQMQTAIHYVALA